MMDKIEYQLAFDQVLLVASMLSNLPLDEISAALERAEILAPFIDPTLFREYSYSDKPRILKALLKAAIPLKRAFEEMQPLIQKELEKMEKPTC